MSNMDTNEQFIEDATMVYLKAYDTAMRKVKNQQLAIIAAAAVSNNYETMGNVTILIRSTESGRWKVSAEELYERALENTPKILAERIRDIEEVLGMTETDSGEEIGRRMFVLTNTLQTFGAACMMYPDALRKFADQWDADFFILPSSVHEVLLLPDHGEYDLQEFKGMVYEINRTQLEPEEILTDSVYYYDRTEGKIRLL